MPMILRCDAPGCAAEASARLTASGRLLLPVLWWSVPGQETLLLACCQAHLVAVQTMPTDLPPHATSTIEDDP